MDPWEAKDDFDQFRYETNIYTLPAEVLENIPDDEPETDSESESESESDSEAGLNSESKGKGKQRQGQQDPEGELMKKTPQSQGRGPRTMSDFLFTHADPEKYDQMPCFSVSVRMTPLIPGQLDYDYQPRIYQPQLDLDDPKLRVPDTSDGGDVDRAPNQGGTSSQAPFPSQTGTWFYCDAQPGARGSSTDHRLLLQSIRSHPSIGNVLETLVRQNKVLSAFRVSDLTNPLAHLVQMDTETPDPRLAQQIVASPFMLGNVAVALDVCLQDLLSSPQRFRFARPDTSSIPDILGYDNNGVCFVMMVETVAFVDSFLEVIMKEGEGTVDRANVDTPRADSESNRMEWSVNGVLRKVSNFVSATFNGCE